MIALYAITDHPNAPLPALGDMRAVADGDLAAVCGPVITDEVTAEALWEHEQIVETLMADRDVLPVRYGTCVPDDDAVARALREKHAEFSAALESVRGSVELAVRVFSSGATEPVAVTEGQPMTGTEYLRAQARAAANEADVAAIVHEPLARAARAGTVAPVNRPGELMRAAYLVARDRTPAFSARVREIQDRNPALRITCTGPWPPYSFVVR